MAAGQRLERVLQRGHRHQGLQVHRVGVGRHQVAGRPVVAVGGDAVPGEVEEHPVVGRDEAGHGLAEERAHGGAARIQQRRMHVEVLLLGQHLRQLARVADRGLERRHLLVGIDADDEGVVPGERQRRWSVATRCRPVVWCAPCGLRRRLPAHDADVEVLGEPLVPWITLRDGWRLSMRPGRRRTRRPWSARAAPAGNRRSSRWRRAA